MQSVENYRRAILNALKADSNITSVTNHIGDFIPREVEYPYIKIGDSSVNIKESTISQTQEIQVPIHIYSDYKGEKELLNLAKLVKNSLSEITISGVSCYNHKLDKVSINQDKTGKSYSAMLQYGITTIS